MSDNSVRLYEDAGFQAAAGEALRPGGLELTKKALAIADFAGGSLILDAGSGCGKTVEYLSALGLQALGIDSSEKLAARARRLNGTLEISIGDVCRLPYASGSLDGMLCECVYNLIDDRQMALSEMHRVLKPAGRLVISDLYLREKTGDFPGLPLASCINGIRLRDAVLEEVIGAGFDLIAWQDETAVYKEFVAGLIMKYGSMTVFWESLSDSCEMARSIQEDLRNVRIGYYLSVWRKHPGRSGCDEIQEAWV